MDDLWDLLLNASFKARAREFARLSRHEGACVLGWEVVRVNAGERVEDLHGRRYLDSPGDAS